MVITLSCKTNDAFVEHSPFLFLTFGVYLIVQLGPDAYEQSCSDGGPGGPGSSGFGHPFGDVFSEVSGCFISS